MQSLTYGTVPADLAIDTPYQMRLMGEDFDLVADVVNEGIDSHLEAVRTEQDGRTIKIMDTASLRCFIRRLAERCDAGNDEAGNLASSILETLDYEWI
jgi:hypothetical protein